jgi:hypothetical protein
MLNFISHFRGCANEMVDSTSCCQINSTASSGHQSCTMMSVEVVVNVCVVLAGLDKGSISLSSLVCLRPSAFLLPSKSRAQNFTVFNAARQDAANSKHPTERFYPSSPEISHRSNLDLPFTDTLIASSPTSIERPWRRYKSMK